MVGPSALIYGVLLPALVAGLLLLFGARGTSHAARPRPVLGALAIGLGYLVAHVMLAGRPPTPWGDAQVPGRDWIAWLVLGAIVLAPLRASPPLERWSSPLYMALFSVLVFKLVLGSVLPADAGGLLIRLALTFLMYIVWNLLDRLALRTTGAAVPVGLVVTGAGIALAAFFSASGLLAQLTGAVCAGLGAAALVGFLDKGFRLPVGAVAIAMIVFVSVLVLASIYDLPRSSAALLVLALLAPWVSEQGRLAALSPAKRAWIAGAVSAVPAAIAVWIAHAAGSARG